MSFFIPTAAMGNGRTLVTIGARGEIMGFFYPRIDFAQNVREGMPAIRLMDAHGPEPFLWTFLDCWRSAQSFEPSSNVLVTRLTHQELELTVELTDVVPPGEPALLRRIVVTKGASVGAVQFMHYLRMVLGDATYRNGVQAYPECNAIVQHFRDVAVALTATAPFAAQCSSVREGQESPTKDAMRAGRLGGSLQAIGRVDIGIGFEPLSGGTWETVLVLAGGPTREEALAAVERLRALPFADAVAAANARVRSMIEPAGSSPAVELADAFERAVISLNDLYDDTEGTFIAAPEFDPAYELSGGYGYCWPRDAAVCALAMQRVGQPDKARRFFDWSSRTQLPDGHWYQRYWTTGHPASAWCVRPGEIQLDQTCAIVHAAGVFARRLGRDADDFVRSYRPTAERATEAILAHLDPSGLHRPSTDLWENSLGSFAYTQAGVIAALREAQEVFEIAPKRTGPAVRSRLRKNLMEVFWQPDRRRWLRRITPEGVADPTLDSSAIGIIDPWEVLDLRDADDRRLAAQTVDGVASDLRSGVRGGEAILRFQGESYMGGGPGCVNTLWLALCRLRLAATAANERERGEQRERALAHVRVALANTSPTGQLPELIPKIQFAYWAAPHALACAMLIEVVTALRGIEPAPVTAFARERARVKRRAPSR